MKTAEASPDGGAAAPKTSEAQLPPTLESVLESNLLLIRKAVATRETRLLVGRLLRQTATVRSQFNAENLQVFFSKSLADSSPVRNMILGAVAQLSTVRNTTLLCFDPSLWNHNALRMMRLKIVYPDFHSFLGLTAQLTCRLQDFRTLQRPDLRYRAFA